MSDDLLTEPLEIAGGELAVRPGPGLGIEIDPDKLAHYRLTDICPRPPTGDTDVHHHEINATAAGSGRNATATFARKERSAAAVDHARCPPSRPTRSRPCTRSSASTRSPTPSTTR